MLFLFHGENVSASRSALLELKHRYHPSCVYVLEGKTDFGEFVRLCEPRGMFASERLIVMELADKRQKRQDNKFWEYLKGKPASTHLALWFGEKLKPTNKIFQQIRKLGGQIRYFREEIPKNIFPFLDALGGCEKPKAYRELHRLLREGERPSHILSMVTWQIRNLLAFRSQSSVVDLLHPYVRRKLSWQVKNFTEEGLSQIFRDLLSADFEMKISQKDPTLILDQLVERITSPSRE